MQDRFSDDDDAPENGHELPEGDVSLETLEAMSPEQQASYDLMISFEVEDGVWHLPIKLCLDENYQPAKPSEATVIIAGSNVWGFVELKYPPGGDGRPTPEWFTYH